MALLHTHQIEVDSNTYDPGDPTNVHSFCYSQTNSPNQPQVGQNPGTVRWDTGPYATTKQVWYAPWIKMLPGNTEPGRLINFHNHGDTQFGGFMDNDPVVNGVSAIAVDWFGSSVKDGKDGLMLSLEAHSSSQAWGILTHAQMLTRQAAGTDIKLIMCVDIGRPGRVRIWLDGLDTPVVDTGSANTHWAPQTAYLMYGPGIYNSSGVSSTVKMQSAYARIGPTLDAMLADTVNVVEVAVNGSVVFGSQAPGFRHTIISSWDTANFQIPTSLGGAGSGGGGGGGTPPADSDVLPPGINRWFGNQAVGGVQAGLSVDRRRGAAFKPTESLLLDTIYASLGGGALSTDTESVKGQVWLMSADPAQGGVPTTLLRETAALTMSGSEPRSWRILPLTSPLAVDANLWYLLALHSGGAAQAIYVASAATGGWFFSSPDTYTGGSDSTWGPIVDFDNRTLSIFAGGAVTQALSKRLSARVRSGSARTVNPSGRIAGLGGGGL